MDQRWTHWYRRALPAYWLFLFCITHFPYLRLGGPVPESDKLAHITAFALLAFLLWRFVETFGRPLDARFVWTALGGLALYAAADEYLQDFVGRSTDVVDWFGDMLGVVLMLGCLEWRRRRTTALQ
jgi:VanZ family protein